MLCNSSLTLGPVQLISNVQKQIFQPSPPGLAGHLIDYHPFLSRCDATLASQCLPGPIFFPLLLLSRTHIFSPKAFCSGNSGCRLYPNPLCPCISSAMCSLVRWLSGSALTQHFGDDSLSGQLWEMLAEAGTRTSLKPLHHLRHNAAERWWHARVQKWAFSG